MTGKSIVALSVAAAEAATPIDAKEAVVHFTVRELTRSATAARRGLDNTPDSAAIVNLQRLIEIVLQPARERMGRPIRVNSGYRSVALNRAVGGVRRSYHLTGRAADLTCGSVAENRRLYAILKSLPHTELIWERGGAWIHVAL